MAPYGDLKCNNLIYETGSGDVTVATSTIPSTAGATFTGDVTLTGASYNVVWDKSDNALEFADNAKATFGATLSVDTNGTNNNIKGLSGHLNIHIADNKSFSVGNSDFTENIFLATQGAGCTFYHSANAKLATTGTGIDVTGTAAVDGVDIAGPYKQTVVAITQSATPTVDLSTGNYFTLTQNANVTQWTFSNPPASRSFSFVIELANASHTTAWTLASGTIKWPADTAPTLSASKTHLIILTTDDGGTTYRASSIVDYTT